MFRWTQESSDNLGKIASDTVEEAQGNPGHWINRLESYLKSSVRYASIPAQIRQFLIETGVEPEEAYGFALTCPHGFFQIYLPKRSFLAGDQDASEAVRSLKSSWYEEIQALDDEKRYNEIIRLIKQMGGIETEKIQSIKSSRCLIEPSPISGFKQFVSADRRFPISISYPERISFFYDFNREEYLHVDWWDDGSIVFGISRQNLARSAHRGDRDVKLLLQGKNDVSQFMLEAFARHHAGDVSLGMHLNRCKWWVEDRVVGERERPFAAKSLVWQSPSGEYGGEWVFFLRFRGGGIWTCSATKLDSGALLPELWTIYNNSVDRDTFNVCITTFRWLSEEFFRSLPAQP